MVFGALSLPQRVPPQAMAAVALGALALQGAGMAAQTAWAVLPAALAGYLVGGVGHGLKNALVRTVIAQRVASAAHGRAFAAYNAARNAAELGALGAGGLLVGALGARNALVLAGLGPVVAALLGLAALRGERLERRAQARGDLGRAAARAVDEHVHEPALRGELVRSALAQADLVAHARAPERAHS